MLTETRKAGPVSDESNPPKVRSTSWKAFSLPLLFTTFVLIHFYLTNYIEVNLSEFLFVAGLLLGLIAAIELGLWAWLKDMDRVGLITGLGAFFFFSYERIVYAYHRFSQKVGTELALVGTADPSHETRVRFLFLLAGVTLLAGVVLFRLRFDLRGLVRFAFLCSVAAVVLAAGTGALNMAGRLRPRLELTPPGPVKSKPDIYVLLLDAFGRPDVLERDYGVRTGPFVASLEKLGFKVFTRSLANYPTTSYALACELNYAYIDQESVGIPADYPSGYPLIPLIHSNRVTRFLREQGYEIINIYGGVHFTRAFEATTRRLGSRRSVNGFFYVFFKHTPVDVIAPDLLTVPELDLRRDILLEALQELRELPRQSDAPRFVMLHVLCPHSPFFVDAQGGRPFADPAFDWEGKRDHAPGYAGQAEFLQSQVEPIVAELLKDPARESVILIQGDHGPVPLQLEPPATYQQRYPNLCALYLPGRDYTGIPEDLSPVNYFRVIFNRFFGTNLELLPNKAFYLLEGTKYFKFTDITDQVNQTSP
ncbi:MAG: hypothetical protein AMXMBFR33_65600 [Candidatus Xenobia bacterium]